MKIQILPSEVVDQIAAGEVVERPSHLVKELIENSLDAGSTEIIIDFAMGGRFVKIIDNGSGISVEDLPKAFLRFATSKIQNIDDLWQLNSFGFRGEALASISSVSQMTVFSADSDSGSGFRVTCQFGKVGTPEPVSRSQGTTIIVEELFQNVPARLKFMKSESAESLQIKTIVKAIAISRPDVSFRLLQENKLLHYWPQKKNWKERLEDVLDVTPLFEGVAVRGSIRCRSFFASPDETAKTSRMIWLFAQGRYIQDRSMQAAVMEAYRNLLMQGEFPIVASFIETEPDQIDVNIHPSKSQVKFQSSQDAFRAVQASIRDVLEKAPWLEVQKNTWSAGAYSSDNSSLSNKNKIEVSLTPAKFQDSPQPKNLQFEDPAFNTTLFRKREFTAVNPSQDLILKITDFEKIKASNNELQTKQESKVEVRGVTNQIKEISEIVTPEAITAEKVDAEKESSAIKNTGNDSSFRESSGSPISARTFDNQLNNNSNSNSSNSNSNSNSNSQVAQKAKLWSYLDVIGQAGLTYIVCQSQKSLVLVDQHAAHERVVFEKLMNSIKSGGLEVQNFLFPLAIDLNEEKMEALKTCEKELAQLGIELEELGPTTIGIKSAPVILKDQVVVREIHRFAQEIVDRGVSFSFEKVIADICASMACHSVVRAGESLSMTEMQKLLEQMDEFPLSCYCPHGRPVSIEMPWVKLEKDFGRIVT
jgi:DNA mismatch repair protein MutL